MKTVCISPTNTKDWGQCRPCRPWVDSVILQSGAHAQRRVVFSL